jgi:uncharacterized protein (UPF0210 family)
MRIRTITCFTRFDQPVSKDTYPVDQIQRCGHFLASAKSAFEASGYEVQTRRLATNPFPEYLPVEGMVTQDSWNMALGELAVKLEEAAASLGIEYLSLGPARVDEWRAYQAIPSAIASTQNVFFSGMMTFPNEAGEAGEGNVSLQAIKACAQVIHQAAKISLDGFANLRFSALANVPGEAPFFPASYQTGDNKFSFALGLEAADLAVRAAERVSSLSEMRQSLIQDIEQHARELSIICQRLASESDVLFAGLDFTLAPFPDQAISIGAALEKMGVPAVGMHGTLAGVAFLADTLDRANYPRTGFNGVFFPVLEDSVLALRAEEGSLGIKDLLLYSAVCGTGLDTVPIPGDASVDQINALLLDLAALAQRLDKPLTARLMPIPGKKAGEPTDFDFSFFANSRVLPLQAEYVGSLLGGDEAFSLKPRR